MKLCKDCEYFHIRCEYENPYEWGEAVCEKHNLITFFRSKKKFETLCCIEEEESREETGMTVTIDILSLILGFILGGGFVGFAMTFLYFDDKWHTAFGYGWKCGSEYRQKEEKQDGQTD